MIDERINSMRKRLIGTLKWILSHKRRAAARFARRARRKAKFLLLSIPIALPSAQKQGNLNTSGWTGMPHYESSRYWDIHREDKSRPYDVVGLVQKFNQRTVSQRLQTVYTQDWHIRPHANADVFKRMLERVQDYIPALKRALQSALAEETRQSRVRNLKRGRIDKGRLHLLCTRMQTDVFEKHAYKSDVDSCVTLVLDDSNSMKGGGDIRSKWGRTADMAVAFGECLSMCGIPFEIMSLVRNVHFNGKQYIKPYDRKRWSLFVYKEFKESWIQVRERMGYYTANHGSSAESEAVAHAVSRMMPRKEQKKLVLLLADGAPVVGQNVSETAVSGDMKDMASRYRGLGVQVYGLGIQSNELKEKMGNDASVVDDLSQLTTTVFKQVIARIKRPPSRMVR